MGLHSVTEIERAIAALSAQERAELYARLDAQTDALDKRIEADLNAGLFDAAIRRAIDDEANGRVRPL